MPIKRGPSMCVFCKHFDEKAQRENLRTIRCTAFPDQIPAHVLGGQYDHTKPHPDDNGIQFERGSDSDLLQRRAFQLRKVTAQDVYRIDQMLERIQAELQHVPPNVDWESEEDDFGN